MRYPEDAEKKHIIEKAIRSGIIIDKSEISLPLPESPAKIPIPEIEALTGSNSDIAVPLMGADFRNPRDRFPQQKKIPQPDGLEGPYDLADIFNLYGEEFRSKNILTYQQYKAMKAIENCRTYELGYHIDVCDHCGNVEKGPNSCRNRHCPKCQGNKRIEWVEARLDELLPVRYYHVVVTLPDHIFPLCLYNQKVIYDLLFSCIAETLKSFGDDPKWLGAKIGFFAVLHTWGQTIVVHPHLHIVIPAGGIDEEGEWVWPKYEKNDFLFPVRAMSKVFRGKFIQGLKEARQKGVLEYPEEELSTDKGFNRWLNRLVSKEWVIYTKAPFAGPEEVVRYVGRYTHRVAISNTRILSIDNGVIRFSYKNYKKKDECENPEDLWEEMELPAEEFIRRFLYHVLPPRYHRIRHFGFLSNGQKSKLQEIWEVLVFEEECGLPDRGPSEAFEGIPCPVCEIGIMVPIVVVDSNHVVVKGSFRELRETIRRREEWKNRIDSLDDPEEWRVYDTA